VTGVQTCALPIYPSIDDFLPIESIASLERLGAVLGGLGLGSAGRPPRTGTPRVHRVGMPGPVRLGLARSVLPRVAVLPEAAGARFADPGSARPLRH
jgi:hypothetical protein